MEKADVDRWLDAYVEAWKSYHRDQIAALFTEDVVYRYYPYSDPILSRKALVDSWRGEGDYSGKDWARDAPGTYDATYRAVAVDGDTAVATGTSTYFTGPGGEVKDVYHNCFVMRFDGAGRCREFTEWFTQRPSGGDSS